MHNFFQAAITIGDYKLVNWSDFIDLICRYGFNVIITFVVVRGIYYPIHRNKEFLFTYFLFNSIIFMILYAMTNVKMEAGIGFGLFAVFSILRYRTEDIPIKEMVYLFIIIAIALINALASKKVSIAETVFANVVIVGMIYMLENLWLMRKESSKVISYEKIENIKPENYQQLLQDLRERTGLDIHRAEIKTIDFLRDVTLMKIFFYTNYGEKK